VSGTPGCGRRGALRALDGEAVSPVPVALFTWGFDYMWQVAEMAPWELACGSREDWHRAHVRLLEYHQPDLLFYQGSGGESSPRLVAEERDHWLIEADGHPWQMDRTSLALVDVESGARVCDPVGEMRTRADVDRLIEAPAGWGEAHLEGLRRLTDETGDRALILPHTSPAYIRACYSFGFDRAMTLMLEDPGLFLYACDRIAAGDRQALQELREAGAEAVFVADGWASCDILSPAMVERFALPYQRSLTEAAQAVGLRLILWNEGDVLPILAQEAAIPMEAFAFEQPRKGAALTVEAVRAVFGPRRCLFGNLDSEALLGRNLAGEIAQAVAAQLAQSGAGAPFVLNTGSPIPSRTPPEAVAAMIAAARAE
jgi:uroporphyrinogen-III decarboxylase